MEQNRDNKKKDDKALFFIQQSVSEAIFPRIIGATTAKEAWDLLKNEFSGNEKTKLTTSFKGSSVKVQKGDKWKSIKFGGKNARGQERESNFKGGMKTILRKWL
ncbi:uncharacterized protein LOC143878455 [Tasmannia lanceolata]|uniref:uncharacterized protein LOC143878455 n=1 Tax=Tasmannia lanceolata TaxID=3420 RepID=UPI004062C34B